jgi:hypothetical protein
MQVFWLAHLRLLRRNNTTADLKGAMLMNNVTLCGTFVCLIMATVESRAGTIFQGQSNASIQVNAYEPVAQSFTAEDPRISFAFDFRVLNAAFPNDPLRLRLLAGDGLGGTELAKVTFSIPTGYNGLFDVNLSEVTLAVGEVYTAELMVPGTSPYFAVRVSLDRNAYLNNRSQ